MYEPITPQINYSISTWINHPSNQPHMSQSITVDPTEASDCVLPAPLCPFPISIDKRDGRNTVDAASDVPAYRVSPGPIFIITSTFISILLWPLLDTLVAFSVCQVCACNQLEQSGARSQKKPCLHESRCWLHLSGVDRTSSNLTANYQRLLFNYFRWHLVICDI